MGPSERAEVGGRHPIPSEREPFHTWQASPPENTAMPSPSLEQSLSDAWPPEAWADVTVLVAVSGGADSVALLRGLASLKHGGPGRLIVAHYNHHFRGSESDRDEEFVRQLAGGLGIAGQWGRRKPGEIETSPDGLEEAARRSRYRFLTGAAEKVGARYVACAHTADDQIETILHRILRGTGIAGLAGMPRSRRLSPAVSLIRPLLEVRRSDVLEYLGSLGQPFREDGSNTDRRFTRNRIRHDLLPELADQYNPAVGDALLRLGRLAGEVQGIVDQLARALLADGAVEQRDDSVLVRRDRTEGQPEYLVREVFLAVWQSRGWPLQSMGFNEWQMLVDMLRSDSASRAAASQTRTFPGSIQVQCQPEGLFLRATETGKGGRT